MLQKSISFHALALVVKWNTQSIHTTTLQVIRRFGGVVETDARLIFEWLSVGQFACLSVRLSLSLSLSQSLSLSVSQSLRLSLLQSFNLSGCLALHVCPSVRLSVRPSGLADGF